ncbi:MULTISPECIES: hypothetical protein [unclassified Methylobacterium]|jgi:hypothetical protein|nr:hypothetical protein [Methylobacterium sp. 2A]
MLVVFGMPSRLARQIEWDDRIATSARSAAATAQLRRWRCLDRAAA